MSRGRGTTLPRVSWRTLAYRQLYRLLGDHHLDILATLRASERWPPERLRATQTARLRDLLLHAWEHVPYYRQPLLDSGVVRPGVRPDVNLANFRRLPLLERSDVRDQALRLRDRRLPARGGGTSVVTTGGTTGDVLRVLRDRAAYQHVLAVQLWFDEWSGCPLGAPKVVFASRRRTLAGRIRARIAALLRNEVHLDGARLTEGRVATLLDRMERARPAQLLARPTLLCDVIRLAEAAGRRLPRPGAVMVSAEALSPEMEADIRRAFGAPVFNRYGTSELGGVACGCGVEPRLHVSALTHLVEVLHPDGRPCEPAETGELVVTPLTNRAMPLLRYRIGDLATVAAAEPPCRCGRTLPSIAEVSGRVVDSLVTPGGVLVNGFRVRSFYRDVPWIRQFQVIQLAPARIHVRLAEQERTAEPLVARRDDLHRITRHIRRVIAPECEVTFEFVDEIPREPSGKYRATVGLVPAGTRTAGQPGGRGGSPRGSLAGRPGGRG